MSGGSLEYIYERINDVASAIAERGATPLQRAFADHLKKVSGALHDLEWVFSGDYDPGAETGAIEACLAPTAELDQACNEALVARKNLDDALGRVAVATSHATQETPVTEAESSVKQRVIARLENWYRNHEAEMIFARMMEALAGEPISILAQVESSSTAELAGQIPAQPADAFEIATQIIAFVRRNFSEVGSMTMLDGLWLAMLGIHGPHQAVTTIRHSALILEANRS